MSDTPMIKRFGKALGLGLAVGLVLMTIITVVTLPASFMMNRLAYHNAAMRFLVGLIAMNLNIIAFIAIFIMVVTGMWNKPYYFGLWPLYPTKGPTSYTGWLALPFKIFSYFFHPIMFFFTGSSEDKEGYRRAVEGLLVKRDTTLEYKGQKYAPGAVCEAFGEDTRAVGAISNHTAWSNAIADLVLTGKAIFGNEEPTTGQQEKTEEIGSLLTQLNQIQTQHPGQGQVKIQSP